MNFQLMTLALVKAIRCHKQENHNRFKKRIIQSLPSFCLITKVLEPHKSWRNHVDSNKLLWKHITTSFPLNAYQMSGFSSIAVMTGWTNKNRNPCSFKFSYFSVGLLFWKWAAVQDYWHGIHLNTYSRGIAF